MNPVTLKIIGCGDAFGSGGQLNTCFYLEGGTTKALIDCGATSLPALKINKIPLDDLDTIVVTHFHGDHYGGIPFVLLHLSTYGQKKPLNIISPGRGNEKLKQLTELLYPGSSVFEKIEINFTYFEDQVINAGELNIQSFPVVHTKESQPHGVRIRLSDKIISYSGDTEWTENLIELADHADLFICECCFYTQEIKGHLNYITLKENLRKLNYKKILLTHFDKEMLLNVKNISLDYATEGMKYEV